MTSRAEPTLEAWLDGYGPGIHRLTAVPPFAEYKLKKEDPRFPDAAYARAVKTAWGRTGPSLGTWCGAAFHFPYVYFCLGGHFDSGLDSIYRVDMVTGAVVVTRPSPLVRPFETSRGIVQLPERDDYLQGHTYASMLAVGRDRLWIGNWSLYSSSLEYLDKALPNAWEVNFADRDDMGYPARRTLAHEHCNGAYLKLPDGAIFVSAYDKFGIADRNGDLLVERNSAFGWNGCYHPQWNAVYGIRYEGQITSILLDDDFRPRGKEWVIETADRAQWRSGAGIAVCGKKLLLFPGTEHYYLVTPNSGRIEPFPNKVFREKSPNRCYNRFITLRDKAYLYIPTDETAHPVLWIWPS